MIVRLKFLRSYDFELSCPHSIQNFQLCNFAIFNFTPPKHQVCLHTTLPGGNSLTLNPISAGGGGGGGEWNAPFLLAFLSSSPQISIDQLHTFLLLNFTIEAKNKVHNLSESHVITRLLEALCFTTYISLQVLFFRFSAFIFSVN